MGSARPGREAVSSDKVKGGAGLWAAGPMIIYRGTRNTCGLTEVQPTIPSSTTTHTRTMNYNNPCGA
ncbi:hypothetical protein EVAR_60232_1 [Eumeta japonica]|uniref:Uncharacterized protein n=1 Tax=Eumeta variegata TaxID=151549 RepID=A0A4C1Z5T3_EUMVA|nr:hypothetical protein EVAR_60232_1 [Eumeta japonica]